ncbi:MAG: (d)CMP kinase [Nitrospirales bacterium]|nr:(d)CMP kinase [Nitrospira sp.]MDR4500416.1 (d)CMP kinase [Nitrospirales bacterium]
MSTIIRKCQEHGESLKGDVRQLVVTIDGPAGVGKSTLAKKLATQLGYTYLDTGALYRAVAWKAQSQAVDLKDHEQVGELLAATSLKLSTCEGSLSVLVDGEIVTNEIRSLAVGQLASKVAALPEVRAWLLPIQREFAHARGIVVEGRDMGTTVFPDAEVKFFLDADLDVRISRRYRELQDQDRNKNWADVQEEIASRDRRDRSRSVAPLFPATDAMMIDTSNLSIDQVLDRMTAVVATRL